ncbi:MAG: hypothetical protein ACYC4P_13400 [Thermoanaerobaculia bacterium]
MPEWLRESRKLASGRDALRWLLLFGMKRLGWRRLWMPTYSCPQVISSVGELGITLLAYSDGPGFEAAPPKECRRNDVIVRVKHFGLKSLQPFPVPAGVTVIEDHSHDPVSEDVPGSSGDFVFASLRKSLPLPDGAVVWSPRGYRLPVVPAVSERRRLASSERLAGMVLKTLYLGGAGVEKGLFRRLLTRGEAGIATGAPSAMTPLSEALLRLLPWRAWRRKRRQNFEALVRKAHSDGEFTILRPDDNCTPFAAIMMFESTEQRDRVRSALIEQRIYPAILWALGEFARRDQKAMSVSSRNLALHCDHRYTFRDMNRVAQSIRRAVEEAQEQS